MQVHARKLVTIYLTFCAKNGYYIPNESMKRQSFLFSSFFADFYVSWRKGGYFPQ